MNYGVSSEFHPLRMRCAFSSHDPVLLRARIVERLGAPTRASIDFAGPRAQIPPGDILGKPIVIESQASSEPRFWTLHCTAVEYHGRQGGHTLYTAELHSKLWFLSRRRNLRIFQEMSTPDIVRAILSDHGFSGDLDEGLVETYGPRPVCVQYRESDLDFISRLMEQEGIHYTSVHTNGAEKIHVGDDNGAYPALTGPKALIYQDKSSGIWPDEGFIYALKQRDRVTTGKVTLDDFDFEKPKADLTSQTAIPRGTHTFKDLEDYDYPGGFRDTGLGDGRSKTRMQEFSAPHQRWIGAANVPFLTPGGLFTVTGHPAFPSGREHLLTSVTTQIRLLSADWGEPAMHQGWGTAMDFHGAAHERYRSDFEAQEQSHPFRPQRLTPWPKIAGIQTATVVGPSGEEIHTDSHGRIKVQFHWDREGKNDDKSFVWVRVMTPWSGKNWGMIHIPRIGQEVVVDFEEGDPDRPIVIGMLYNADTMPPYELPSKMTQSGIKTNSSKGGGGFNEVRFEDKKGAELVNIQAQRDFNQLVKNNATIKIGEQTKKDGDLQVLVHNLWENNVMEDNFVMNVHKKDHATWVAQDYTSLIDRNKLVEVEGKEDYTITGNQTFEVKQGHVKETVKMGNWTQDIKMGNRTETLNMGSKKVEMKLGNLDVKNGVGKQTFEALQGIELKCMGNSIKIDPTGITIKGLMVKIEGQIMVNVKGLMTEVKGDAVLIAKGGITMIN
ncbi:type VI secretion system tip protein VgrG [Rhodobacteraceae bacterium CCMM004]|nr:type VI secretion system tip protein VgrG [Rhodobacteraceae bacterium CCMM004]